jgi:rfaE bifunctional protein kinase chain/domain
MAPSILEPFQFLDNLEVEAILKDLSKSSVAVLGDFCLDVYWMIDHARSETSLETGVETQPVHRATYSPGGAGNVVMNLRALGVGRVFPIGLVGDDPFGREMHRLLDFAESDLCGLLTQDSDWATHAYVKPYHGNRESSRLDHGNYNVLSAACGARLLQTLRDILPQVSVVLINHQVTGSIQDSAQFRAGLRQIMESNRNVSFIVDSRGYHEAYPSGVHKLNDREVMRSCERTIGNAVDLDELVSATRSLVDRWNSPLVVTRGDKGCLVCENEVMEQVFGVHIAGSTDPVGAGDTFVATLAALMSAGTNLAAAAWVANLAAAVTARKLYQTGTASPREILSLLADATYTYRPELANAPHRAHFLEGSEIEVIAEPLPGSDFCHAIFDHDGTISTLREGWEHIMQPMMMKIALGDAMPRTTTEVLVRVEDRIRRYIEDTTGLQTIVQMTGLVDIIRELGFVPPENIESASAYKEIYNQELLEMVNRRREKLVRNELQAADFTIKGAVRFLRALRESGVRLYLASGTDEGDVRDEAEFLGYADLFDGGIFGSIGNVAKDAKRVVIERILSEIGNSGEHLIAFGDGPVEMRETVRRGAYAVGVASDELRRFGGNLAKRARLIRAGAHVVIPDFSQWEILWNFLRLEKKASLTHAASVA